MALKALNTKEKALTINLDPTIFGTIAEIGGGQEVARHFFQAGGASNTVAKTISAYDKSFSDKLYNENRPSRYVAKERLEKMLRKEYQELTGLLSRKYKEKRFFVFANTVETLNYFKTNQGQGWLGVAFQTTPCTQPNEVLIHVKLLENDALLQQYTLGSLGINLVYACFFYAGTPSRFLKSLLENLDTARVEIDFAEMRGPDLEFVDNRLLNVQLVKNGMTPATMFDAQGQVHQPADLLYKKNVLAIRGTFRPLTNVGMDIIQQSNTVFQRDKDYQEGNTITMCEMTLRNLMEKGEMDERDFLDRVDLLNELGQNVMISNFLRFYRLVDYFSQFKMNKLRVVVGLPTFKKILDPNFYEGLPGGILEAMGRLFSGNTKLYVYPTLSEDGSHVIKCDDIEWEGEVVLLYQYLLANRRILNIECSSPRFLSIQTQKVLKMIQEGTPGWEEYVPVKVADAIKRKNLFDYMGWEPLKPY